MRLFFLLITLSTLAIAESDPLDHKKGPVYGMGFVGSRYTFPSDYEGSFKKSLDDKATLLGGSFHLGYDIVLFRKLLLGLRGEGMIIDSLGMGNKEEDSLNGKMRATNALVRAGLLFDAKTFDPVGDVSNMTLEVFFEGGISSGHRTFRKKFNASGDEYDDNLEEEFQGQIIAGGLNLTSRTGAFFELKGAYTSINHTRQKFTGMKTENGSTTSLDRTLDDKKGFTTFSLLFGHHL
jgi:hypothetical protein